MIYGLYVLHVLHHSTVAAAAKPSLSVEIMGLLLQQMPGRRTLLLWSLGAGN